MKADFVSVWRITEFSDLSGNGGRLFSGRWNHKGQPIIYCADHPSTAMLEILVNSNLRRLPQTFQLAEIKIPVSSIESHVFKNEKWATDVNMTRDLWQDFCTKNKYAVLKVPSVVMPVTSNFLINPEKVKETGIEIINLSRHAFDERFRV